MKSNKQQNSFFLNTHRSHIHVYMYIIQYETIMLQQISEFVVVVVNTYYNDMTM